HVWGALKGWEKMLGRELIVWDKGQRARLTPFGEKLLWAERQTQARLAPQIETLRGDIERAYASAFDDSLNVLTICTGENPELLALRDRAARGGLHLDLHFMGSVDAVAELAAGRCTVAAFHTCNRPSAKSGYAQAYRPLLKPEAHTLIRFGQRRLGLIVAPGNPLGITSLADLLRAGLRYVHRAPGSGTRLVLDALLASAVVDPASVQGYTNEEPSHAAVAQAVASGRADAGLGMEAATLEKGLGFVPLVDEVCYLACETSAMSSPAVQALLGVLQSQAPDGTCQHLSLPEVLPWWKPRASKTTDLP
ncbi:MAG: substrate-binding domain-containing protein, partial [Polaromonas sp.]